MISLMVVALIIQLPACVTDHDPKRKYNMIWRNFPLGEKGYQDNGMCDGKTMITYRNPDIQLKFAFY